MELGLVGSSGFPEHMRETTISELIRKKKRVFADSPTFILDFLSLNIFYFDRFPLFLPTTRSFARDRSGQCHGQTCAHQREQPE